jgi:hypothetical protein
VSRLVLLAAVDSVDDLFSVMSTAIVSDPVYEMIAHFEGFGGRKAKMDSRSTLGYEGTLCAQELGLCGRFVWGIAPYYMWIIFMEKYSYTGCVG